MNLERSAHAFGQVASGVSNAGVPTVALPTPWHKQRGAAGHAVAMLAFATGLLVAALGAVADEPVRPGMQPTAEQFTPPNQSDVSPRDARAVDELYHLLMGPQPANSFDPRSSTPPSGGAKR